MAKVAFLAMLFGGILSLVAGLFVTRRTWRSDVEPFGRQSSYLAIALHPERFASPDRLGEIRSLNLIGAALLCGAVVALVYEALASALRP